MGSLLVATTVTGEGSARMAVEHAAAAADHRGTLRLFTEGGIAIGVQVWRDEASLWVADDLVIAQTGYLTNGDQLFHGVDATVPAPALAELWRRCGRDLFTKLRGEYALAVLDRSRRQVWLASSLLGGCPLYMMQHSRLSVVASEPRQVLAGVGARRSLDIEALVERMSLGFSVSEPGRTIISNVRRLVPPMVYRLSVESPIETCGEYWQMPAPREVAKHCVPELELELKGLLEAAVRDALPHSPGGLALSGGLDSTTMWSLITRAARDGNRCAQGMSAVAIVYPGREIDESEYIDALHQHLGTNDVRINGNAHPPSSYLRRHMASLDHLPIGGTESNNDVLCEHIRGQGGTAYLTGAFVEGWVTTPPAYAVDLLRRGQWLQYIRHSMSFNDQGEERGSIQRWRRLLANAVMPPGSTLRHWFRDQPPEWLTPAYRDQYRTCLAAFDQAFHRYGWGRGRVVQSLQAHQAGASLEVMEQIAANYQLEMRSPLMDQRLVEFGLQLPAHLLTQGVRHKQLMRGAVGRLLPDKVRERNAKVVHNETVELDLEMLSFEPEGEWRLVDLGVVRPEIIRHYKAQVSHICVPRTFAILIKCEQMIRAWEKV